MPDSKLRFPVHCMSINQAPFCQHLTPITNRANFMFHVLRLIQWNSMLCTSLLSHQVEFGTRCVYYLLHILHWLCNICCALVHGKLWSHWWPTWILINLKSVPYKFVKMYWACFSLYYNETFWWQHKTWIKSQVKKKLAEPTFLAS